jgi:hypothetical protein
MTSEGQVWGREANRHPTASTRSFALLKTTCRLAHLHGRAGKQHEDDARLARQCLSQACVAFTVTVPQYRRGTYSKR